MFQPDNNTHTRILTITYIHTLNLKLNDNLGGPVSALFIIVTNNHW